MMALSYDYFLFFYLTNNFQKKSCVEMTCLDVAFQEIPKPRGPQRPRRVKKESQPRRLQRVKNVRQPVVKVHQPKDRYKNKNYRVQHQIQEHKRAVNIAKAYDRLRQCLQAYDETIDYRTTFSRLNSIRLAMLHTSDLKKLLE